MTTHRGRILLFGLLLLSGVLVSVGTWGRARHQYSLDRQLIAALVKKDTALALSLVQQGADPNTHYRPLPPLSFREMWNSLIYRSPPPSNQSTTAFLMACGDYWTFGEDSTWTQLPENPRLVETMLAHGAHVNDKDEGVTPLEDAIYAEYTQTVPLLLARGADINVQHDPGYTMLCLAVSDESYVDRVERLLHYGADPNLPNSDGDGNTPLQEAVVWSRKKDTISTKAIPLLLKHGANPNLLNKHGESAISLAAEKDRLDLVTLFLHADASQGDTTLHLAVRSAIPDDITIRAVLHILLKHGADPNQPNKNGQSALQLAQDKNRQDLVSYMRRYGAKK